MADVIILGGLTPTNVALLAAYRDAGQRAHLLPPTEGLSCTRRTDVVIGRIDIRPGLNGGEPGLGALRGLGVLRRLEESGVRVLNRANALYTAHDKLATALTLGRAGIPHPTTAHVGVRDPELPFDPPFVVKPRFGSRGRETFLCETNRDLRATLRSVAERGWFQAQGALVQELISPCGFELRLVVAGGEVVGAVTRSARAGDWLTNIAPGESRAAVLPSVEACRIAVAAAREAGADFVGVDLLPRGDGYTVLELNGCVDFTDGCSIRGEDVFARTARALLQRPLAEQAAGLISESRARGS